MTSFEFNKIKESINSNLSYLDRRGKYFQTLLIMVFLTKEMKAGGILI